MRDADWTANPFVHEVELDFVPGSSLGVMGQPLEMWGGLGAALLLPEPRTGSLVVGERNRLLFEETMPKSAHAGYFGFGSSGSSSATGRLSSYTYFAGFSDDALRGYLVGEDSSALGHEPPGFLQIRHRLGRQIPEWRLKRKRVAIYGTGEHTRALLGLLPELYSIVACFIDRRGGGEFLGRPCVEPGGFSDARADVVVYSSRAFEHEMRAALASHPVEHVLLYS
jgi:hypothetical protein